MHPWFVGVVSGLVGAFLYPLFTSAWNWLRACLGPFTGRYIAFTGPGQDGYVLIEDVRCRHNGTRISGTIYGVAFVKLDTESGVITEASENTGIYRFRGFVDERVFVISYRTLIPGLQSSGSITLQGDTLGKIFSGSWAGVAGDKISHNSCAWVRLKPSVSSRRNRSEFLRRAKEELSFGVLERSKTAKWSKLNYFLARNKDQDKK
jgi:hypothetical protein